MLAPEPRQFDPSVDVLMTPRPITIDPFGTIASAAALMKSCRVRHLPVVSGDALVGVLSLRDVVAADDQAIVGHVMTRQPQTAMTSSSLSSACEQMLGGRYSCLPVVDGAQRLVGVFTATDALRFARAALETDERAERRAPPVSQLMTARPLVTVEPTTALASAWQLMTTSARAPSAGPRRRRSIVGLLSDRDVLAAGRDWLTDDAAERQPVMLVADAMSTRLSTTTPDRPAIEAAADSVAAARRRAAGAARARAARYAHGVGLPLLDPGAGLTETRR